MVAVGAEGGVDLPIGVVALGAGEECQGIPLEGRRLWDMLEGEPVKR